MRPHRLGPVVAGLTDAPHDLGALAVEVLVGAHWRVIVRARPRVGSGRRVGGRRRVRLGQPDGCRPRSPPRSDRRCGRIRRARAVALGEPPVRIGALDPHPPTHADRRQRALIDPVPHRLLIELQQLGDLGNGQERFLLEAGLSALIFLIETNWYQFNAYNTAPGGRTRRPPSDRRSAKRWKRKDRNPNTGRQGASPTSSGFLGTGSVPGTSWSPSDHGPIRL